MNKVLGYASFAVAVTALVIASQSAVGEKPFTGTHVVYESSEPAITSAWVYYPSQFGNKAKNIEPLPPQF